MASRRIFLKESGIFGLSSLALRMSNARPMLENSGGHHTTRWPDGSRLVLSISMQFEAGGQPENAESPFPQNMKQGFRDHPASTWYEYGYKEGIPRMLDNWDDLGVKVTSHMVGAAVLKNPGLAKQIVERGHEAAAHGMNWSAQYDMTYQQEKDFIKSGADAVKQVTGATVLGYNANWLRRGDNTLTILQELGFKYHIDDLSRDEPFIVRLPKGDFAVVPYTLRCNDILLIEGKSFSADQFLQQCKFEFDRLYQEGARRRRLMSLSFHDRIGGTPQMVKATSDLIKYIQRHKGVAFKRKDEIADIILSDPNALLE
jgi:peptidoglycan/xylan/chitin deacetylase (PgdA/CDA1 family)